MLWAEHAGVSGAQRLDVTMDPTLCPRKDPSFPEIAVCERREPVTMRRLVASVAREQVFLSPGFSLGHNHGEIPRLQAASSKMLEGGATHQR